MQPATTETVDVQEVYFKICAFIDKTLSATKAGIAAFKKGADGTLFNAFENINESFKLLEDAINHADVNTEEVKVLKIGVNTDAQNWFLDDQNRYEWEPKAQYDTAQLIEFYEKMINDHPLLEYIEDGFADKDIQGYKKCIEKFTTELPQVQIGVNTLFESDIERIRLFTQMI